eukprot:5239402-Alexandrium_andersonii.AAC.1
MDPSRLMSGPPAQERTRPQPGPSHPSGSAAAAAPQASGSPLAPDQAPATRLAGGQGGQQQQPQPHQENRPYHRE